MQQLPPGLWAKISKCMILKQWACVAGTCKATWDVPLENAVIHLILSVVGDAPEIPLFIFRSCSHSKCSQTAVMQAANMLDLLGSGMSIP